MTGLNMTRDNETLKELMLGNSEAAVRKLLESVFNALLNEEASEQVGAEPESRQMAGRLIGTAIRDVVTQPV